MPDADLTVIMPPANLAACEVIIERGLQSFTEVGMALMTIRDGRLYRASYPTFEAYCEDRWGFTRVRAHQLIDGAETTRALTTVNSPLPTSERQARELSGLQPEQAAEVMTEANQATNGKPTAAAIGQARLRLVPQPIPPERAKPKPVTELDDQQASIRATNMIFGQIIPQLYGVVHDPKRFLSTYNPADNPNAKSAHMLFTPQALHGMADQLHKLAALMEETA